MEGSGGEEGDSQTGEGRERSSGEGFGCRQEVERRRPSEVKVRPERRVVEEARVLGWAGGSRAWRGVMVGGLNDACVIRLSVSRDSRSISQDLSSSYYKLYTASLVRPSALLDNHRQLLQFALRSQQLTELSILR